MTNKIRSGYTALVPLAKRQCSIIRLSLFFCRGELTLKSAAMWILGMLLISTAASTPMYYMAQIKGLVEFQVESNFQDILICREMWPKGRRMAYKTCCCIFQFLIPLCIIVSNKFFFSIYFITFYYHRCIYCSLFSA